MQGVFEKKDEISFCVVYRETLIHVSLAKKKESNARQVCSMENQMSF